MTKIFVAAGFLICLVSSPYRAESSALSREQERQFEELNVLCAQKRHLTPSIKNALKENLGASTANEIEKYLELNRKNNQESAQFQKMISLSQSSQCIKGRPLRGVEFSKDYRFPEDKPMNQWNATRQKFEVDKEHAVLFQGVGHVEIMAASRDGKIRANAENIVKAVRQDFKDFNPDVVIVEGISSDKGLSPCESSIDGILQPKNNSSTALVDEVSLGIQLAMEKNINFVGGEPSLNQELSLLKDRAKLNSMSNSYPVYAASDIGTFQEFKFLAQHFAEKQSGTPESLEQGIRAVLKDQPDQNKMDPAREAKKIKDWFRKWEGKDLEKEDLKILYKKYLVPKTPPKGINGIFAFEVELRDAHLRQLIENLSSVNKRVLVIYGGSHLDTNKDALEKWANNPPDNCGGSKSPSAEPESAKVLN